MYNMYIYTYNYIYIYSSGLDDIEKERIDKGLVNLIDIDNNR